MNKTFILSLLLCCSFTVFSEQQTWYLMRHFEKLTGEGPHLSEQGMQHNEALASTLNKQKITKIYSTQYNRTIESVVPLADKMGLDLVFYDPSNLALLAEQIKQENNVLIVGHSNITS